MSNLYLPSTASGERNAVPPSLLAAHKAAIIDEDAFRATLALAVRASQKPKKAPNLLDLFRDIRAIFKGK